MLPQLIASARTHTLPQSICLVSENSASLRRDAILLVKMDLCEEEGAEGCNCCNCRLITSDTHPDMLILEPEGKSDRIMVDRVRAARKEAYQPPFQGRTKAILIDRAHRMNPASANAILKVLEEPPELTRFILLTSNDRLLLPTIRSRCSIYAWTDPIEEEPLPDDLAGFQYDPPPPHRLMLLAEALSHYPLTRTGTLLARAANETGRSWLRDAAWDLVRLTAETGAVFQNRLVIESILLKHAPTGAQP